MLSRVLMLSLVALAAQALSSDPSPIAASSQTSATAQPLWCLCNDHTHCQNPPINLRIPTASNNSIDDNQTIASNSLLLNPLLVCEARGLRPFCYASKHRIDSSRVIVQYGCLARESNVLQCIGTSASLHHVPKALECCNSSQLCNLLLKPQLPMSTQTSSSSADLSSSPSSSGDNQQTPSSTLTLIALVSVSTVFGLVLIIAAVYFIAKRLLNKGGLRGRGGKSLPPRDALELRPLGFDQHTVTTPLTNVDSQQEPMTQSLCSPQCVDFSSGSGSGVPKIVQRTIAKEVSHLHAVGRGRFGEVWRGEWRHEDVAVKVFYSTEEASWARESSIYEQCLMRHENILAFLASDISGTGGWTQMVLITEYHPLGSLHDFLSQQPMLTLNDTLRLIFSAAKGVAFLHTEICGNPGKPALAHRDIKSRNILLKSGGVCCIADLGLAVRYSSISGMLDPAPPLVQGTKRYFAPEILDATLDTRCFEALTQADMYAFSLVMWETLLRCSIPGQLEPIPYRLPFSEQAPNDPSVELMQSLICEQGLRPPVSAQWLANNLVSVIAETMVECWQHRASARLTSLRVKKTFRDLDETVRSIADC